MKQIKQQIEDAFVDIRNAYRLLTLFQRRVIDLSKYISEALDCQPYWWDNCNLEVRSNKHPVERNIFDMTPLYTGTYMLFLQNGSDPNNIKVNDMLLEIQVEIDSCLEDRVGEKNLDVSKLSNTKNCESYIYIGSIISHKNETKNWLHDVYKKLDYPNAKLEEVTTKEQNGYTLLSYKGRLNEFFSKNSIDNFLSEYKKIIHESKQLLES